jgi:L-threonylcarbamoyladenylate synthase
MKTISGNDAADPLEVCRSVAPVLEAGGLVCLPCGGRYRLLADVTNANAVLLLMQSKGRIRKAPALVFIDSEEHLALVADHVDPMALRLARALWPQPLTIRVTPHPDLPAEVLKQLGRSKSRIGVRIPGDELVRSLVRTVDRPLLVSSANKEKKAGDSSPAQVRRSFAGHVDLFVDQGDLSPEPLSTVIDVKNGKVVIERAGAISAARLDELAAA